MQGNIWIGAGIVLLAAQAYAIPNVHLKTSSQGSVERRSDLPTKPPKSGITGDVLNITQCYCESAAKDRWGFYLQADYANYHIGHTYQVRQICNSDKKEWGIPHCWDEEPIEKVTGCDKDEQDNQFCFQRDYHVRHSIALANIYDDNYWFNNQKRRLDENHPQARPPPEECQGYCDESLDGMTAPKLGEEWGILMGDTVNRIVRLSDKVVFTDLDDMCWNCRKEEWGTRVAVRP